MEAPETLTDERLATFLGPFFFWSSCNPSVRLHHENWYTFIGDCPSGIGCISWLLLCGAARNGRRWFRLAHCNDVLHVGDTVQLQAHLACCLVSLSVLLEVYPTGERSFVTKDVHTSCHGFGEERISSLPPPPQSSPRMTLFVDDGCAAQSASTACS